MQAVANDRWRLSHAVSLESGIFAEGITQPDEVASGNAEVDTALAQARVWISKGGNLQLLGLYESRIQRRFEKNMVEIRTLQAERKSNLEQALEEADLLGQLAESKGEDPTPWQIPLFTKFDFSDQRYRPSAAASPRPPPGPKAVPGPPQALENRRLKRGAGLPACARAVAGPQIIASPHR